MHHHPGRGGNHVEGEPVIFHAPAQELGQQIDVLLEAHALAGFDEVLTAHAAEFRVVAEQVGQLRTLLDQVDGGQAPDLFIKSAQAEHLAQDDAGIVKAQRLVEVAGE